jgi:DNA-binding response OmpR family regulator
VGRILFVDDDLDALETYQKAVSLANHHADVASDASSALELIRAQDFDLIFVDINLPDVSGLDLIHQLSADQLVEKTPVMVLSALPEDNLIARVLDAGAKRFLAKPVSLSDLLEVIALYDRD